MKFTGQVRVPEVDHPGVPATIVVEEGQTEVFLEGETLGRWSLYDVHASRLVSAAFSLSLGGEEITFIADEPVDFAYKGVDHMAEVWARYKSMTIPRRVVAVGRSRRGTVPSRIPELREAMLQNLDSARRSSPRFGPVASVGEAPSDNASWTRRIDAYSNVPPPLDDEPGPRPTLDLPASVVEHRVSELEPDLEPSLMDEPASVEEVVAPLETVDEETPTVIPRPAPLRPGPGLMRRSVVDKKQAAAGDADQVFAPPAEPPPLTDSPWDEPPYEIEPLTDEVPPDADVVASDDDRESGGITETQMGPAAATAQPEADLEPAVEEPPEAGEETLPEPVGPNGRELIVDLGHLEDGDAGDSAGDDGEPLVPTDHEPDLELLFAGAPSPAAEKSGLLGAVRSAFARNRTSHEHEFVEAPGGIGIVRQICAECGYISIGVSD